MLSSLSPALVPIVGAFLVPFLHGRVRDVWVLSLPVVGLLWLLGLPAGDHGTFMYLGLELTPVRIDAWSRIFGIIFFIASLTVPIAGRILEPTALPTTPATLAPTP